MTIPLLAETRMRRIAVTCNLSYSERNKLVDIYLNSSVDNRDVILRQLEAECNSGSAKKCRDLRERIVKA